MTASIIRTALVAATLAAGLGSAAHAQEASLRIRTADLATTAGRQQVLVRITHAARLECAHGRTLAEIAASKACAAQLTEQMVRGARSPSLTALWSGDADTRLAANVR